eukprot:TRINITY_DN4043_c1_g2_i1.p1 TRINITY_DN4043_c1_g2~~TRINITY_DN4043_c1_g2_i1.p1  ORF type:complete len:786 (-),score=199.19 TRINITY_DN4043_c1_g2_i1:57-2414(-)
MSVDTVAEEPSADSFHPAPEGPAPAAAAAPAASQAGNRRAPETDAAAPTNNNVLWDPTLGFLSKPYDAEPRQAVVTQRETLRRTRWKMSDWLWGTSTGHVILMVAVAVLLNLLGAFAWMSTEGNEDYSNSFEDSLWLSWGIFFDPGTQTGIAVSDHVRCRVVVVVFSILGFLFNLLVLGVIVQYASEKLDGWKRSRSMIVANGHVLLLGWTEKTLFLLREITARGAASQTRFSVVILADREELQMQEEISRYFPEMKGNKLAGTKILVRQGSPCELDDLVRVSAASAKEIVILGKPGKPRDSDLAVMRIVVALAALPHPPCGTITAEVRVSETAPVIDVIYNRAEGVIAREAVNRILCLMAIDPLVGEAYRTLSSFVTGEELYCIRKPLALKHCFTFGEVCSNIDRGICIGLWKAWDEEAEEGSQTLIAPSDTEPVRAGDRLLLVARDKEETRMDKSILEMRPSLRSLSGRKVLPATTLRSPLPVAKPASLSREPLRSIMGVVGWANDLTDLLKTLDCYVAPGSEVHVLAELSLEERKERLGMTVRTLDNIKLKHIEGPSTSAQHLALLPLRKACAVLVLAEDMEQFDDDSAASDSACLATMVTLHNLLKGEYPFFRKCDNECRIICEVLDPTTARMLERNQDLMAIASFFHSNAMETSIFAMASSERIVFNTMVSLLQPNAFGDIVSKQISEYTEELREEGEHYSYPDLAALVRTQGDVLLGWKRADDDLKLNPPKSPTYVELFVPSDHLIVIAKRGAPPPEEDPILPSDKFVASPSEILTGAE